jgi:hypothetical protein
MYCGAGASCFASASQEDLKSKVVMWALFGRWIKLYGFSCYNAERVREREREKERERFLSFSFLCWDVFNSVKLLCIRNAYTSL